MANVNQIASDVLGTINGALAILDKIPKLNEGDGNFEFGISLSPFTLITELLKNTKGANIIIDWLSTFLVFGLTPLEVALKTLLMTNIKGMITCSLNPIIPNDLLINGIVFDLKEIDKFNMLRHNPLDKKGGKNYYFGCEEADIPDNLRYSQDFNAVLWYMLNRSNCREIWTNCGTFVHKNIGTIGSWVSTPLKDTSCVDIDLKKTDKNNEFITDKTTKEWVTAKWNDYNNENPDLKNIPFIYNNNQIGIWNGETVNTKLINEVFKDTDILYQYDTITKDEKECLQYEKGEYIFVDKNSIKKQTITEDGSIVKIKCGTIDKNKYSDFNLSQLDSCKVPNDDYYYCNNNGIVVNQKGEKQKIEKKNKSFKVKTNLLTLEKEVYKIGKIIKGKKLTKNAGIVTLEYNENSSNVTNCIGEAISGTSLPYRNCLHVFLGNVQPSNHGDIITLRNQIESCEKIIKSEISKIESQEDSLYIAEKNYHTERDKLEKNNSVNKVNEIQQLEKLYEQKKQKCNTSIEESNKIIQNQNNLINAYNVAINSCEKFYRPYTQNYYYKRTLLEFNFDYIWSLKLFDSRVVTTQLLDNLFNCTPINLKLSYEEILLQEEVRNIVKNIIEYDNADINDCFFSFSNEQFNNLVAQTEKIHQGLYTTHSQQQGLQVDINNIYDKLNNINPSATKEEQKTQIEDVFREVEGVISTVNDNTNLKFDISGFKNIYNDMVENLLTNLATVLTQTLFSPKVYLLFAVNMKIMGGQTDITIEMLISKLKNLIVDAVRLIRDQLLDFLTQKLMEIMKEIAFNVGVKLALEQAMYYYEIIMKLIECFKINKLGFTVDDVNYADIYAQEPQPPTEC